MYKSAYDRLCSAVRTRDESGISRAANDLTVRGIVKDAELTEHLERIDGKLSKLSGVLSYKTRQFSHPTERTGHRDRNTLQALQSDIADLTEDIRILNRLHNVVAAELNRRGVVVAAMTEERHTFSRTAVHA
jgi:hypothetical protein